MGIPNPAFNGMIVINKPRGFVSKDVSRLITRRFGKGIKLGHVGTLDPLADGVLPILLGKATRLQDPLLEHPKTYKFSLDFGYETDTLDLDGKILRECERRIFREDEIEAVLSGFRGDILQVPPLFSAIKLNGVPLYKYARKHGSESDELPDLEAFKRKVTIHSLRLLEVDGRIAWMEAVCSKGTYVRSLGRDIAYALDSCATLRTISRTAAAGVTLENALTIEALESLETLNPFILPIERIKTGLRPFYSFGSDCTKKLSQGQKLLVPPEFFVKSLGEFEIDKLPPTFRTPLFILDDGGRALGVGEMQSARDGFIEVHMTRGLQ